MAGAARCVGVRIMMIIIMIMMIIVTVPIMVIVAVVPVVMSVMIVVHVPIVVMAVPAQLAPCTYERRPWCHILHHTDTSGRSGMGMVLVPITLMMNIPAEPVPCAWNRGTCHTLSRPGRTAQEAPRSARTSLCYIHAYSSVLSIPGWYGMNVRSWIILAQAWHSCQVRQLVAGTHMQPMGVYASDIPLLESCWDNPAQLDAPSNNLRISSKASTFPR